MGSEMCIRDRTNTSNELGELFVEKDLHALFEKGHEIASHTFHHSSCRSVPLSAFATDVQQGMKAVEHLTGCSSGNFAYPYGHVTLAAKKTLAPHLRSARSIIPGVNRPDADLNLLRANCLYGDTANAKPVQDLILQNTRQKGWLIFYTHDVRPNPSEYGCTPELFELAVSEAAHCGSQILTVAQVVSQIGIAAGNARITLPQAGVLPS